jgi:hypothetical protein
MISVDRLKFALSNPVDAGATRQLEASRDWPTSTGTRVIANDIYTFLETACQFDQESQLAANSFFAIRQRTPRAPCHNNRYRFRRSAVDWGFLIREQ